jgi:hypothetical protein
MLRFDLDKKGDVEPPRKAAAAVDSGNSIVTQGLMIPVGGILLVLDPTSTPPLRSLQNFTREDTSEADESIRSQVYQDLIYNPQQDEWAPCGQGLNIEEGAIAAFREGSSPRLWVLQPNRKMHTLTGAYEHLFAPNYVPPGSRSEKYPSKPLPPMMDGKREITIINQSGTDLVPVDDACRAAGIYSFSATGMADVTPMLRGKLENGTRKTFAISYDKDKPAAVTMRFMVADHSSSHYLLELTFSGSDLSAVTSVFKGMAGDGQITEIPETLVNHPANNIITVPRAARLVDKLRLFIINAMPGDMNINPWEGNPRTVTDRTELEFNYATPNFRITIPQIEKVGTLRATFDLAKPLSIETSPGSQPQRSMVRLDTTLDNMMGARVQVLKAGAPPFEYEMRDGTKASIPTQSTDSLVCQVGIKTKREFDGVLLGDAVMSADGELIYIPLAKTRKPANDQILNAEIWRINTNDFGYDKREVDSRDGVFAWPNTVAVSKDKVYAMFKPGTLQETDRNLLQAWKNTDYPNQTVIALAASPNGYLYVATKKEEKFGSTFRRTHGVFIWPPTGGMAAATIEVENAEHSWHSIPTLISVSPDGVHIAVSYKGKIMVASIRGGHFFPISSGYSVGDAVHMTHSHDGNWLYSAHADRGGREDHRDLTISRITYNNMTDLKLLRLTEANNRDRMRVNGAQKPPPPQRSKPLDKKDVPFTLAVSPDDRELFVSVGKSIMKVDMQTFTLRPWRAEVEAPCRLIAVGKGHGNTWTLYAMGHYYVGDGNSVSEYKTHLYILPVPKG